MGRGQAGGHNTFCFKDGEMGSRGKDSTLPPLVLLLSRIGSLRGGVAGEGIWLRHLRTSAAGGGKEGRAGELAQAAGTAATALGHRSHFRPGPSPWKALEQSGPALEVPPRVLDGLCTPVGEQAAEVATWAQRERPPTCTCAGWSHLPSTQEQGVGPGKGDPFLVNHPGVEGQPRAQPTIQLPGQETVPISFGKGSVVRHSGPFRVPPHPPNHHVFPVPSLPPASLPPL